MLDEPMAGVNPALKQRLLGHMKALREEGMTVLFVEHDMDVVRDISDWVIVMAQGKVIAEGPPTLHRADQRVIDAYLGAAPRGTGRGAEDRILAEASKPSELSTARDRSPARCRTEDQSERGSATSSEAAPSEIAQPTPRGRRQHRRRAATTSPRALVGDDLVAGYVPGVNILNGCDLYLPTASWSAIIGPNGAGKSTLLKALFGLIPVRSRPVTLRGEDITALPGARAGARASATSRRPTTCSPR